MCWETAYEQWLNAPALSQQEQEELRAIQKDKMELRERFYAPLAFGTAGLRGTMKVGLHHMNVHVVRWVTQGFAEVICAESDWAGDRKAAVCMDGRKNSRRFAEAAAEVLAANGITVYLFDGPRPTPELSFAVRAYGCLAGINITASHNPKEYNGYKAYWCDGASYRQRRRWLFPHGLKKSMCLLGQSVWIFSVGLSWDGFVCWDGPAMRHI